MFLILLILTSTYQTLRIGVSDDLVLHETKGRRRDGEGVVDLDHPVTSRLVLIPAVRRHPVVVVVDLLDVLVPVDE